MVVPTVRSIAAALGMSRTTVSDALSGSPRVNRKTADLVRKTALALGYHSNALATSVMSDMRRRNKSRGLIAMLELQEFDRSALSATYHRDLSQGVRDRAMQLGLNMETFLVANEAPSLSHLKREFKALGVGAIIVLPANELPDLSSLDWKNCRGVCADCIVEHEEMLTVYPDHFRAVWLALKNATELGYRRPGVVLQQPTPGPFHAEAEAAFLAFQSENENQVSVVPPLKIEHLTPSLFRDWFRQNQPDVVISSTIDVKGWMEVDGAKIPADHGFICLNTLTKGIAYAGLDIQPRLIGASAVDLASTQLGNERGRLFQTPFSTAIAPKWVDGPTIRRQSVANENDSARMVR